MGLKSNFDYLLEEKKISGKEYETIIDLVKEHDRHIKNNTISKTKHSILSEIEFTDNMSRDEKNRAMAVVRTAVNKMKFRGNH